MFLRIGILALLVYVIPVCNAAAEEVTIVDSTGLIRLKKSTITPVSVQIQFACNPMSLERPAVILTNENGLIGDTELPWTGPCSVDAHHIPPGRWKVRVNTEDGADKISLKNLTVISAQ